LINEGKRVNLRVLGIDPGLANTGYGLVEEKGGKLSACGFGSISTRSGLPIPERLDTIYRETVSLIRKFSPDIVVLEKLFFNTNRKTAGAVGEARGVILLACEHCGVQSHEYAPLEVKMAVVGNGNAKKEQVKYMVGSILKLSGKPVSLHTTDALAIAICHVHSARMREMLVKETVARS